MNNRYKRVTNDEGKEVWRYNWNIKPSKYMPHQGAQECERRRRRLNA